MCCCGEYWELGSLLLAALEVSCAPAKFSVYLQFLTFLGPASSAGLPFQQTPVHGPRSFSRPPCLTAPSSTFGWFALSPVLCSSKDRVASLLPITVVHLEGNRCCLRTQESRLPSLSNSQ